MITRRTTQAVKFLDHQHITGLECLQALCQLWPRDVRATGLSVNTLRHLARFNAASCRSGFWSSVDYNRQNISTYRKFKRLAGQPLLGERARPPGAAVGRASPSPLQALMPNPPTDPPRGPPRRPGVLAAGTAARLGTGCDAARGPVGGVRAGTARGAASAGGSRARVAWCSVGSMGDAPHPSAMGVRYVRFFCCSPGLVDTRAALPPSRQQGTIGASHASHTALGVVSPARNSAHTYSVRGP